MVVLPKKMQDENMEWCKAQQISLSMNIVGASKQHLRFLAAVGSSGYLYNDHAIEQAIFRYKNCWLPLLAKHMECSELQSPLVVPLDCEWIWHCHRLNPVQYRHDCEDTYGKILGNMNVVSTIDGTSLKQSEAIWDRIYPTEPFYLDLTNQQSHVTDKGSDSAILKSIDYDLAVAVERQSSFSSKILRVVKFDESLIKEAVERYKAFLHLMKKSDERREKFSFVPTFDIDLIWHTHQLNPIAYYNDVNAIFGRVIDHNDRNGGDLGRERLLHGFVRTKELWELTYDCMYCMEGDVTQGNDSNEDDILKCLACEKYCIG